MLYMCVTTIASYSAPHAYRYTLTPCTYVCGMLQCAGSQVRFGIVKMAVAVRRYLYLRIEGDRC